MVGIGRGDASDPTALEAFAHVVSHDLRAPLRGLSVHLRLLERDLEDGQGAQERIETMQERLRQMDAMLLRLRAFSKVEASNGETEPIDMAALVAECWQRAGSPDHRFATEGEGSWAASPLLVTTVVEELLRNAHQHHDQEAGSVQVRLAPGELTVEDDGPGLPAEPDRLMQPFSKAGANGQGAGLALAQHIMGRLGGTLELSPRDERGTRARITWPR